MNQHTSKRQGSKADQPEQGSRAYRRWQRYVQGVYMGAFLFLPGHFLDVLVLNLPPLQMPGLSSCSTSSSREF